MDWIEWAQYGAAAMGVIILGLVVVVATKRKAQSKIEPPEPVQKYDKFPEPMKTVETRDGKDIPY